MLICRITSTLKYYYLFSPINEIAVCLGEQPDRPLPLSHSYTLSAQVLYNAKVLHLQLLNGCWELHELQLSPRNLQNETKRNKKILYIHIYCLQITKVLKHCSKFRCLSIRHNCIIRPTLELPPLSPFAPSLKPNLLPAAHTSPAFTLICK